MLGDAALAGRMAERAARAAASTSIGFSYPVVPQGKARIRTQMSAAHSTPTSTSPSSSSSRRATSSGEEANV